MHLPPYRCSLNTVELVWSEVKGYVARNNTSFKPQDVRAVLQTAIQEVTSGNWRNCVQLILKEEESLAVQRIDGDRCQEA